MRLAMLLIPVLAVVSTPAFAQAKLPGAAVAAPQPPAMQRRIAPPPAELLEVFVEIAPYTNLGVFDRYDAGNKIKLKSRTVLTVKQPGKNNPEEARARSPRVVGERSSKGVLPVALWTSPAKVESVDFLIGGEGTRAIHPAEIYQSPAVLAGGDQRSLEQIAYFVSGFHLPVTVRVIYQDGQVWMATFVIPETAKK